MSEIYKPKNITIFGDSYEYTRKYREFYKKKEEELKLLNTKDVLNE